MRMRGFTTIELLVALGLMLTVGAIVYEGVRPQVRNAGAQVRVAAMQQSARGSFDLFARDLRMAGYGVDITKPGSPAPVSLETDQLVVLNANFSNVKTLGSGAGSTVTVASTTGFAVNNYLVITSFWGGEARRITGVSSSSIQLASPLSRIHPSGSEVQQVERLRYQLDTSTGSLTRESQPMMDGVQSLNLQYYLADGTLVTDPAGVETNVRTALVNWQSQTLNKPSYAVGEDMTVQAEVRIRNLGLTQVSRPAP